MRRTPAEGERNTGDHKCLKRYRNRRLKILDRLGCGRWVEIPNQCHEADEQAPALECLLLAGKSVGAIDILLDSNAPLARQRLRICSLVDRRLARASATGRRFRYRIARSFD